MQQIQYIKINQLHESGMNPRKEFHQESIDQLAESIKQVGILQPIIARPNTTVKKKAIPIYEVICGARRLSAAVVAELVEVPVIVRDLNDDEAFDLMITENLQRKDVSPLEEALAFQSLIQKGKYDINTLSERFGKSQSYIRLRLKLNDLIQEFKNFLQNEIITVSHAVEICKLEPKYQTELFNEDFKDRSQYWNCPPLRQLKNNIIRSFTLKLEDAPFNILDVTLDKVAGPCIACQKNTASNMILFPDSPESGLCLDRSCYKHKSDIHFDRELKRIQDDEPDIIIGTQSYIYGEDEKRVAHLKKSGFPLVEISWQNGFYKVNEPIRPEEPIREDYEDEEDFKEALDDYNSEMNEYEDNLKEYEDKVASGTLRKVFMTVGNDTGKTVLYEIKNEDRLGATGKEIGNKELIKELQDKDKRNAEIAFEKTYLGIKELFEENLYSNIERELSPTEWQAVYILLLDFIGYVPLREELNGSHRGYIDNKDKAVIASKLDINQINRLFRAFLQNKLNTSSPNYQISEAKALIEIATECYPDPVKEIELKHQGTYLKRKESIDKRIVELQNQKS